jgi:phosphatidylserine decarboxylase
MVLNMRIQLTKYGWPQVILYPALTVVVMVVCLLAGIVLFPVWVTVVVELLLLAALIWILSFFRDPYRIYPSDDSVVLSPADGRVTDIEVTEENNFIGGAALRLGIFMGVFDVHINRAPCNVRVEKITYRKGRYTNAANPASGRVNESNDLSLIRVDDPADRLVVRQISGAIARRIVCEAKEGQKLTNGQKFGMVKFGSRTELYVPIRENVKCLVQIGNKVKAGLTVLVKYEQ